MAPQPVDQPVRLSPTQVTNVLCVVGLVIGFVFGTTLLAALQVGAPGGFHWGIDVPFGMVFGGTFGALVGAFGAPILGWSLLRRVPLGRAIGWTFVATAIGAAVGSWFGWPVLGALGGFILGPILLNYLHRPATA